MSERRILVTGSREWDDRYAIRRALLRAARGATPDQVTVVHGGARGADVLAGEVAGGYGWRVEVHLADWQQYGKSAGRRRNARMVTLGANVCVAFALRWNSGCGHCARLARAAGIPVVDFGVNTAAPHNPDLFEVAGVRS